MFRKNEQIKSICGTLQYSLKSDSHLPKKIFFIYFNERPLKMMKNAFYFMLKALFVLKIFKIQSCFGYDEEMFDQEDKVNFKIYDVTT